MKALNPQPIFNIHSQKLPAMTSVSDKQSRFAVATAPPDALFNLMARCKADTFEKKVDLGVGAYRDNDGKSWLLPSVDRADKLISSDPTLNHEYLPIAGLADFCQAAAVLIFGADSPAIAQKTIASIQTISGTGANHLAGLFLARFAKATIHVSDPTWANHHNIYKNVGLTVKTYPYYDPKSLSFDFEGMLKALDQADVGDIILLHACAHNPTGIDPTPEQWTRIADVMEKKSLVPLFDCAYQGFASGDLGKDAWAVRHFVSRGMELLVCQSFAKNFGLYGERAGCLHLVTSSTEAKASASSQLNALQRAEISNPPAYGARIVSRILSNPDLFEEWRQDLDTMSSRIISMRLALRDALIARKTPGTWNHIVSQIGMFSYTGLSPEQVDRLVDHYHIYLTRNGRISMAGLNEHNVDYVADAIDAVVREALN